MLENRIAPAVVAHVVPYALSGFTPAQFRTAYGINTVSLDGTGQTIAILGLYNNPDLLRDLDSFDQQFDATASGPSLYQQYGPASSFVMLYNQNGQTSPLPSTDPLNQTAVEEVLDVEWAHAIAPGAKIDFVEANTATDADANAATITAASLPGVSVFSTSYADSSEIPSELSSDSIYTTPGVTFLVASGDNGTASTGPPVFSPNVIAVGGTTLTLGAGGSYVSETGWGNGSRTHRLGGSGGGVSLYEAELGYQQAVQTTGKRTAPDVAFDANPGTGVAIADSFDGTANNPWAVIGGTSLGAPSWAGLMALVNQGRAAAGENALDHASPTETLTALYSLPSSDFHANLGGNNGTTTTGLLNPARYNEVTGLGSPVATLLVADLVAYGSSVRLTPTTVPNGTVNTAYSQTFSASGGSGTKTLTGTINAGTLPAGLAFTSSPNQLVLSGTPTASGTVTFTVTATDSAGATATQSYTLTISPALSLSPPSVPASTVGVAYHQTITASNGTGTKTVTVTVTAGALPMGLSFTISNGDPATLAVSGTPATSGTVTFKVTVTDSAGASAAQSYTLTINPAVSLGPPSLPAGNVGSPYNQAISASGGTGLETLAYAVTAGVLPAGLAFALGANTLLVSGTPTAPGTVSFNVTATDSVGATVTQAFSLAIDQAPALTSVSSIVFTAGRANTFTVMATGFPVPALSETGALPNGVTFVDNGNGTATLHGTPALGSNLTYPLTIKAANGVLPNATQSFTLNVEINPTTVQIIPVTPGPLTTAVASLFIVFSAPVADLNLSSLSLTRGGGSNLLTSAQTLTSSDLLTWTLGNLAGLTDPTHQVAGYTLTLNPAGIVDQAGNPLVGGASTSFTEVDSTLNLQGSTLTLPGTSGNDTFTFTAGTSEQVTLNGVPYTLDPSVVSSVQFQGNGGTDSATLTAAGTGNTATLTLGSGSLHGTGYTASVSDVTDLAIIGGGSDTATFTDSSGTNSFIGAPTYSYLTNNTQVSEAAGFKTVTASSTSGKDTAFLYEAAGNHTFFVGTPANSYLDTSGVVVNEVLGFQSVVAQGAAGTTDPAYLYDVSGSNTFIATPAYGYLLAGGAFVEAVGFKSVVATAAAGTSDSAAYYDTAGQNTFIGAPTYSYLLSGGVFDEAIGFMQSRAIAPTGGQDTATLYGSTGQDAFVGAPTYSYFLTSGVFNEVFGFASVVALSAGGSDSAVLYDAAGAVNTFIATPSYAILKGPGYVNEVVGFTGGVTAQGTAGSSDTAYLYGSSAGGDRFVGTPTHSYLLGSGFDNEAVGFGTVLGYAQGPGDLANLFDSTSGGTFVGQGSSADLSGAGYGIDLSSFAQVVAVGAAGGANHLSLGTVTYAFSTVGTWTPG
jgi:hypothetical protein